MGEVDGQAFMVSVGQGPASPTIGGLRDALFNRHRVRLWQR
jgi:hypothetical protein